MMIIFQLFDDVCQDLANAPPMVLICTILVGTLGAAFLLCSCIVSILIEYVLSQSSNLHVYEHKTVEPRFNEPQRDGEIGSLYTCRRFVVLKSPL